MSNYIHVPNIIKWKEVVDNNYTLSSPQYKRLIMPNNNSKQLKWFLERPLKKADFGVEIGALNYIEESPFRFIRTKALQEYSFLLNINKETSLPIMPSEFVKMNLKEGDLIISKDSNIGEIVILDKDYSNCMLSGALCKLPIKKEWAFYILAFVKHSVFREQLDYLVPKGATIRHAKTLFLDCKIPIPNNNVEEEIRFVSILTKAIVNKEKCIRQKHNSILNIIDREIKDNQKETIFEYNYPCLKDIKAVKRLDASLYKEFFKRLSFNIINYKYGFSPLTKQNLDLLPGPSLELKLLGTRIDSDKYIKGFYRLITPKQITNYGVTKNEQYIGTPTKIANIQFGDILFGESGTGRTMVFLDRDSNTINNAHAHILRSKKENDLDRIITIRSILQYYKEVGLTDCMTVGGSGGHLSPSYFDRILIPHFPEYKQKEIAVLYHNPQDTKTWDFTLDNFMELDNIFNQNAGIYELDGCAKFLKQQLKKVIDDIVNDRPIDIKFCLKEIVKSMGKAHS